jgi:hypothetical protein
MTKPSPYITKAQLERRLDRELEAIGKWTATIVKPLVKRIAELEEKQFRFLGAWSEGLEARAGHAVSHDGSTWIATERTLSKPGTPNSGWTLAAKRGKDGKDARKE